VVPGPSSSTRNSGIGVAGDPGPNAGHISIISPLPGIPGTQSGNIGHNPPAGHCTGSLIPLCS
jgi:hypothetical protein